MAKPANNIPFSATTPLPLGPAYGMREGKGTSTTDDAGAGAPAAFQGGAAFVSTPGGPVVRTANTGDYLSIPYVADNPFDAPATEFTLIVAFKPSALPGGAAGVVNKRYGYGASAFAILNTTSAGVFQGIVSTAVGDNNVTTADSPPLSAGTAYIGVLRARLGSPVKLRFYNRTTGQIVGSEVSSTASLSNGSVITFAGSNQGVTVGRFVTNGGDYTADLPGDYEFLFYSPTYIADGRLDSFAASPYANYAGLTAIAPGTIGFGTKAAASVVVNLTGMSGGQAPYSIQFQQAPDASGLPGNWANVGSASTATSYTATGLTAATSYWFRAIVADAVGSAPATTSAANVATAGGAGIAISPPTLANTATHRVGATWSPATGGTGPYAYQLQAAPSVSGSPGTWADVGTAGTVTTGTALGLDPGATYYFRVVATDSVSGSATSTAATISTPLPDIPGYATWWGRMPTAATTLNPGLTATATNNAGINPQLNHDGTYGAIQALALRPGQSDLLTYRDNQLRLYRDGYLVPNNGGLPAYYAFPEGLGLDWETNGSTASRDALVALRNNGAYINSDDVSGQGLSRETAYAILTQMEADRLGLVARDSTRFPYLINCALGHIDQWMGDPAAWVAQGSTSIQPFMMGITGLTLAKYSEFLAAKGLSPDPRILPALTRLAVRMRERFWRPSFQDFIWPVAPDGSQYDNGDPIDRGNGDLNLETTNFFGWLYCQTGSAYFKLAGDEAFAAGVQVGFPSPKQFNQMLRWSFLYTQWRQATPIDNADSYVIEAPFVPKSAVGTASTAFRVVPLKPLTGTITPNDGGQGGMFSPASITLNKSMEPASFTYTPATAGAKSIGATNSAGATDPAAVQYVATADSGGRGTSSPVYPPANKVQAGTAYGPNGNDYTGTLVAASPPIFPTTDQVLAGVVFGPTDSTSTGTVALPAANQVLAGVAFGPGLATTGALATGSGLGLTTDQVRAACIAAIASTPVRVDMGQPLVDVTTPTLGGAFHGAWANCWGKTTRDRVDRMLRVFGIGSQAIPARTFALDNADNPTTKVPQ